MEALILYFGKVIICSGVMFLYYQIALKDKTFHHYNRFYLLAMMVVSMILPLLKIEYFTIEFSDEVFVLLNKIQTFTDSKNTNDGISYLKYINWGIAGVAVILLCKLLFGIFKIIKFKSQFQKENFEGINFYQTNLSEAPFSYFKNLFWKNSITINSDIGKQILKHEMVHIEQKHSYDKIFIEIVTAIFWFNPFFYFIKKEINLIHEYLADNKAVRQSDTKAFAQMLLASHFSGNQLTVTSPFLSSNLKKRLKMIQKPKTKFAYARRLFALPVVFTVAFAYMVNAKNREIEKVNDDAEKIMKSIENRSEQTNDEISLTNAENVVSEDTIKPTNSQISEGAIVSNLKISGSEDDPLSTFMKDADDQDIFLVEGKEVSRSEFADFLEKNRETPNYVFSHSARKTDAVKVMIYSAAKNNDKVSSAVRNKMMKENNVGNDMFLFLTKMQVTDKEREDLRQSVLDRAKAKKASQEAEDNTDHEATQNVNFVKGIDDAERLRIKSEKELEARKENIIMFKHEEIISYVKNKDQTFTKDDRKSPVKSSVMILPLKDGQFFIDGKEFTKEELRNYMKVYQEEIIKKDIASARAPFKSVKMYRTPYGDRGFSKLDKVEFSTK